MPWKTTPVPEKYSAVAADGSEIRRLFNVQGGSIVHCTLRAATGQPGSVSFATYNTDIEEIWYFLEGEGEIWRKSGDVDDVQAVRPGTCLTIPERTVFQFRNTGQRPLVFLCVTIPPWKEGTNHVTDEEKWPHAEA